MGVLCLSAIVINKMFYCSASPLFSRLKKTLKLDPSLPVPPAEPQKVNINGHAAVVGRMCWIMLRKKI